MSEPESYDDLPTWQELVQMRGWIMAGCPIGHRESDPRAMVRLLWKLMEGLPHHLPIYAWGSDEWKAEHARHRGLVVDLERISGPKAEAKPRTCSECGMTTPLDARGPLHHVGCGSKIVAPAPSTVEKP